MRVLGWGVGMGCWDGVLGWGVGMGCWDGVLGWGVGMGCWDGVLGWGVGTEVCVVGDETTSVAQTLTPPKFKISP